MGHTRFDDIRAVTVINIHYWPWQPGHLPNNFGLLLKIQSKITVMTMGLSQTQITWRCNWQRCRCWRSSPRSDAGIGETVYFLQCPSFGSLLGLGIFDKERMVRSLVRACVFFVLFSAFSALTLLVGRQEGHPACKNRMVGIGVVICLEWGADLHMAQLMPLPCTVSCSSKIQIGFTFLVPAYPGCPGKEAVKW